MNLERAFTVPCDGDPNYATVDDGYLFYTEVRGCQGQLHGHRVHVSSQGEVTIEKSKKLEGGSGDCIVAGRLPEGLWKRSDEGVASEGRSTGRYFADMAVLEAASVAAFAVLAEELEQHGAPRSLVRSARRAVREEKRHAILCRALARVAGLPGPETSRRLSRSWFASRAAL